jgi:hypothetical protein
MILLCYGQGLLTSAEYRSKNRVDRSFWSKVGGGPFSFHFDR